MPNLRLRRLPLKLAASLLAGAVVTVGVAWGSILVFGFDRANRLTACAKLEGGTDSVLVLHAETNCPGGKSVWAMATFDDATSLEPSESSVQFERRMAPWATRVLSLDPGEVIELEVRGWPLLALRTETISNVSHWRRWSATAERNAGGVILLQPLWPGFALDTLFYGGLAFLLWSAPGVIRRRVRKRRSRCPACGYDLRGSPAGSKCPECGA